MDLASSLPGPPPLPLVASYFTERYEIIIFDISPFPSSILQALCVFYMTFLLSLPFVEYIRCVRFSSRCLEYAKEQNTLKSLPSLSSQNNVQLY